MLKDINILYNKLTNREYFILIQDTFSQAISVYENNNISRFKYNEPISSELHQILFNLFSDDTYKGRTFLTKADMKNLLISNRNKKLSKI